MEATPNIQVQFLLHALGYWKLGREVLNRATTYERANIEETVVMPRQPLHLKALASMQFFHRQIRVGEESNLTL